MTHPWPDPPQIPPTGPRAARWPVTAPTTMPPAPWTHDPNTVTQLTTNRPGAVETADDQPCGWCRVPINQGAHHTRPVHYTPAGADKPVIYGGGYCAFMDHQGVPHLGTLPRLVEPAPAGAA